MTAAVRRSRIGPWTLAIAAVVLGASLAPHTAVAAACRSGPTGGCIVFGACAPPKGGMCKTVPNPLPSTRKLECQCVAPPTPPHPNTCLETCLNQRTACERRPQTFGQPGACAAKYKACVANCPR